MPAPQERASITVQSERSVLAAVRLPESRYDRLNPFGELRALAEQAGAVIVGELTQQRERPESGTYMGSGKVEELRDLCKALNAGTIIFDHDLSPKQIANIEEVTSVKVIDRSELILDIFAARASTHEAQLQVELAQLEYTYPRLRAMWSHLERQVGGGLGGGIGTRGPGEQQLEIDRRLAQQRKGELTRELREIQGRKRREVRARNLDYFTVGLVGYTNAGKSTLFNTLTAGGAYADNRLFATLMTRTRQWDLGGGLAVMLSDTVGFVRDLPHNLIASFKATLEEATHADLLLIVLDVSDPAAEMQYETVTETLDEIIKGVAESEEADGRKWRAPARMLLLNKADQLQDNAQVLIWQQKVPGAMPICALPAPKGVEHAGQRELIDRARVAARGPMRELEITVPLADAKTVHTIENRGEVLDRKYEGSSVTLVARLGQRQLDQLRSAGARMTVKDLGEEAAAKAAAEAEAMVRGGWKAAGGQRA
jgi:GTP-binding protein HflX